MAELTAERARELFSYDPVTGLFRWNISTSNRVKVGSVAGCRGDESGRILIRADGASILRTGSHGFG